MPEKKSSPPAAGRSRSSGSRKEPVCEHLSFAAKEAFKRLRTNLVMSFPKEDTSCHLIGVTSAQPGDGKSTVAVNLAYSLAELGKRVMLIDADLRRSSVHEKLGLEKAPGLSNLLEETDSITDALRTYRSSVDETAFRIIPGGDLPHNPSELLNSKRMGALLQTISNSFDYVIIDLPPIGAVVDAVSVSQNIDGMVVVVRENSCPRGLLSDCIQQLEYAGVSVMGFVVNGAMEGSGKKYQYDRYNYYNSYYN